MPRRILVTRPAAQSASLLEALRQQGDEPVALPLLSITPVTEQSEHFSSVKQTVQRLAEYQHLICISTNAVDCAMDWIDQYWPQLPIGQRWYAIGRATADRLAGHGIDAQQSGLAMNSESLLQLPSLQNLNNQKVLIFRGVGGREHLRQQLQQRGAAVDYCEVYQRQPVSYHDGELTAALQQGLDFLTVTSTETIQQLLDQAIIDGIHQCITCIPIVASGDRVAEFARQQGFSDVITATNAGLDAMLDALNNKKI